MKAMSDEELEQMIRHLSKAANLGLSEERVGAALPAFKMQLKWIELLNTVDLSMEAEPAPVFQLKRWTKQ
ncbi:MAG: hypothetical protein HY695_33560 [Deltaproteobacteria bacterium]|nr:hypothetical protein [Deltaproteobacteria bacterium]